MTGAKGVTLSQGGTAGLPEEMVSLCSLRSGGRLFGIDTRRIREVLGKCVVAPVPLAPAFIGGVLPYRGEVLTTVSLHALLQVKAAGGAGCVLVLDGNEEEERFGLLVDSVGGVVIVDRRQMAANPATLDEASKALFAGAYRTEDGLLVELDPERLTPSGLSQAAALGEAAGPRVGARSWSLAGPRNAEGDSPCEC